MRFDKNTFIVSGMIMLSRLFGFIRDILLATVLGTGPIVESFFIAFRIPNLFRSIFAEGIFNSVFIPFYNKKLKEEGSLVAFKFSSEVMSGLIFILLLLIIFFEIFMPFIIKIIAWGVENNSDKYNLIVKLTRIMFPYIIFLSIMSLITGILNSFNKFAISFLIPVLLNIILILCLLTVIFLNFNKLIDISIILSYTVIFAGFIQVILLWLYCKKQGKLPNFTLFFFTTDMKKIILIGLPSIIAGSIVQFNTIINTGIASFYTNAISYLYYADRLYQLPLGVIGVAISVVLLPNLTRAFTEYNQVKANILQNKALEFAMMITIPAMVAFLCTSNLMISVLFERGLFDSVATTQTSIILKIFSFGLPAFVAIKIFLVVFFANRDTLTPMYYSIITIIINIILSTILARYWQHIGIAIATSIAGWFNVFLLIVTLYIRDKFKFDIKFIKTLFMICISSTLMGICIYYTCEYVELWLKLSKNNILRSCLMILIIIEGIIIYVLCLRFTKVLTFNNINYFVKFKNN